MSQADLVGWYDFEWSGGKFDVSFRPGGHFFVPKFQAPARWKLDGDEVKIDWGKFGKYIMKWDVGKKTMDGMEDKEGADPATDWRKANFREPLSAVEKMLYGLGAGTTWELEWKEGSFPVQFKCDGYNHFKCVQFPAHAHWSLDGDDMKINWGAFGTYTLKIDAAKKTMAGAGDGAANPPADDEWRKARWLRDNTDMVATEACDGTHEEPDKTHTCTAGCDHATHEVRKPDKTHTCTAGCDHACDENEVVPHKIDDGEELDGGSVTCKCFG